MTPLWFWEELISHMSYGYYVTSRRMKQIVRTFDIQCGEHRGRVSARNVFSAWRKIVGDASDGFSPLARFREILPASKNRKHKAGPTPWQYAAPRYLDYGGKH